MRGNMRSLGRLFPSACKTPTLRAMGTLDLESNPSVAVAECPSVGYGISVLRGIYHEARQDTALELDAASLAEASSFEAGELTDSHSATVQDVTSVSDVEPRGDAASSASASLKSDRLGVEGYPTDACFVCGEVGHFAQACSKFIVHDQAQVPEKMCPCGAGVCKVLTAMTVRNAGRRFYKCTLVKTIRDCGFFEWCKGNTGSTKEDRDSGTHSEPLCPCGAGVCIERTARTERNMGRKFYRCPLGQGKGCSFFKWCDEVVPPSQATIEQCHKCEMDGHSSKDCSLNDKAWNSVSFGRMTPFWQEESRDAGTCYKCGLPGHWARDCSSRGNEGATGWFNNYGGESRGVLNSIGYGSSRKMEVGFKNTVLHGCFKCGSPDHWAKDCRALRGPPQGPLPGRPGAFF